PKLPQKDFRFYTKLVYYLSYCPNWSHCKASMKKKANLTRTTFGTRWKWLIIFQKPRTIYGCAEQRCCTIMEKHRLKSSIKNWDGLFTHTNLWARKWCINFSKD